ncbi:MAG: sigma-70 family RNA polymerase sigma factor [Planctomycetota bacterium]
MYERTTRASLIARLGDARDEAAWRDFDEQYRELILRYCTRRGLEHWDGEDVRQIVMLGLLGAFRNGFQYRPSLGRFRGYLFRVVQNAISTFRAQKARAKDPASLESLAKIPLDDSEKDADWEEEWRHHHLRRALSAIRSRISEQSLAIFDRLLEGSSVSQAAAAFGMSEAAVYKVKQRIKSLLEEQIAAQIRDEDGLEGPASESTGR